MERIDVLDSVFTELNTRYGDVLTLEDVNDYAFIGGVRPRWVIDALADMERLEGVERVRRGTWTMWSASQDPETTLMRTVGAVFPGARVHHMWALRRHGSITGEVPLSVTIHRRASERSRFSVDRRRPVFVAGGRRVWLACPPAHGPEGTDLATRPGDTAERSASEPCSTGASAAGRARSPGASGGGGASCGHGACIQRLPEHPLPPIAPAEEALVDMFRVSNLLGGMVSVVRIAQAAAFDHSIDLERAGAIAAGYPLVLRRRIGWALSLCDHAFWPSPSRLGLPRRLRPRDCVVLDPRRVAIGRRSTRWGIIDNRSAPLKESRT